MSDEDLGFDDDPVYEEILGEDIGLEESSVMNEAAEDFQNFQFEAGVEDEPVYQDLVEPEEDVQQEFIEEVEEVEDIIITEEDAANFFSDNSHGSVETTPVQRRTVIMEPVQEQGETTFSFKFRTHIFGRLRSLGVKDYDLVTRKLCNFVLKDIRYSAEEMRQIQRIMTDLGLAK